MKNYKKFIFDLDYTLLIPDWSRENDYFKRIIPLEKQEEFFRQKQGILASYEFVFPKYDIKLLSSYFSSYGFNVSEEVIVGWLLHNSQNTKDQIVDGVIELFEYLTSHGKSIVILTNWFSLSQVIRIKRAGLYDYVEKIIAGDRVMKPYPGSFKLAIGDTDKEECLMIGDSPRNDKEGALNVGIDCYLLGNEHSIKDLLQLVTESSKESSSPTKKKIIDGYGK